MSALSAGVPDECSVVVSLLTDKTRHHLKQEEKNGSHHFSSSSYDHVSFLVSALINFV